MSSELITLLIIFWLPPAIVITFNVLWDLKYWQASNFHRDRLYTNLRWDFHASHRRTYITTLKVILFIAASSLVANVPLAIPLIAVLFSYVVWSAEALLNIESIARETFPIVKITWRSGWVLSLVLLLMIVVPIILAFDLFSTTGLAATSLASSPQILAPIALGGITIVPTLYLYLVFATMIGLAFDLASPIFTTLGVYVTAPFDYLYQVLNILKAKALLSLHPGLLVVTVSGSYGKTITKDLLAHILKDKYHVIFPSVTETNISGVSKFILNNLDLETEVLIVDMNAYQKGDIAKISEMLRPHVSIITGIDESHVGLFGSMEETKEIKAEVLTHLRAGGSSILNIDDVNLADLALQSLSKEVLISQNPKPSTLDRSSNKLESDFYSYNVRADKEDYSLIIHRNASELIIPIEGYQGEFSNSIVSAVAAATELGLTTQHISSRVQSFDGYHPEIEMLDGDIQSHLLIGTNNSSIKSFKYLLNLVGHFPKGSRMLVTSGIKGLGKHTSKMYEKLAKDIKEKTDIVITYDKALIKALGESTEDEFIHVSHPDDLLYQIRARTEKGDAILIHGDIDRHIVERLRE